MAARTSAKAPAGAGKAPEVCVYLPEEDIGVPDADALLRALYARVLDTDERGDIRVKAASVGCDLLKLKAPTPGERERELQQRVKQLQEMLADQRARLLAEDRENQVIAILRARPMDEADLFAHLHRRGNTIPVLWTDDEIDKAISQARKDLSYLPE